MRKSQLLLWSFVVTIFLVACGNTVESNDDSVTINSSNAETTLTEAEPEPESTAVSFYGVGDNLIHSPIFNDAQTGPDEFDFKPIYENIADHIEGADIAYINQETLLGGDEFGYSGYPAFNTPSDMAGSLVGLGFDIVNGGNNHTLDMGVQGIENTLEYWSEYEDEALYTGAFNSQEMRDNIPVVEKNGLTFSVLSYTYATNGIQATAPYQVNYFDPELITQDVKRAQEVSDFVIVAAHWGDEHSFTPNQMQLDYAKLFADLGVDVVVGSHPHTIQPVEWVTGEAGNETLVIYSLGNIIASSIDDINLLGGSIFFDFVEEDGKQSIENVVFEPIVIHYENSMPGVLDSRTDFRVYELNDYTEELASRHGLNVLEPITVESYQQMAAETINEEFLNMPVADPAP